MKTDKKKKGLLVGISLAGAIGAAYFWKRYRVWKRLEPIAVKINNG